jgi:hypothetical protein
MALLVMAVGPVRERICPILMVPPELGAVVGAVVAGAVLAGAVLVGAELAGAVVLGAAEVGAALVGAVVLGAGAEHPTMSARIVKPIRQEIRYHFFIVCSSYSSFHKNS